MSSVNKCILVGNLGQDPDVRHTQAGDKIVNLSVATSESWNDKHSGERRERTEWHRVVIFGKLADIAAQYLHKGSKIYAEGRLQTRKWQDKDGNDRYSTEVVLQGFGGQLVLLDRKEDRQDTRSGEEAARDAEAREAELSSFDDSIPF